MFQKIDFICTKWYHYYEITKRSVKFMSLVFESIMLVCFGLSWPINVIKAYQSRTAKSTSLPFILLIFTGYIAGIMAKIITHQINYVLIVYLLNIAIVMVNIGVYFRNAALDKKVEILK